MSLYLDEVRDVFLIHGLFWFLFLNGYPYFIQFYSSGFLISLNSGYTCILEVNNTTPYPYGGWFSFPGLSSADLPWRLPVQCSECFHKTVRNLGQEDWCVFPLLLNFCQNVHHSPPICPFLFYPFYWLFPWYFVLQVTTLFCIEKQYSNCSCLALVNRWWFGCLVGGAM